MPYAVISSHPYPITLTTIAQPRFLPGVRADANGMVKPSHVVVTDAELAALQALSASDVRAQGLAQCLVVGPLESVADVITPSGQATLDAALRAATVSTHEIEAKRQARRYAEGV